MQEKKLTILVIDDDPGDAELLYRLLEDHPDKSIEYLPFTDSASALARLREGNVDVIFVDYLLGPETGLDVLGKIKQAGVTTPIIMLTGQGDEEVAVEAMKSGAADYLIKGRLSRDGLHRTLLNVLEKAALHQKIEEQRRELERLARTDGLTGLYNRRFFMEQLGKAVRQAQAEGTPMSLLMIDLDHFKSVNDSHGHLAGDRVLIDAASIIRAFSRDHDVAGRFGGEEFCLALSQCDLNQARGVAEKLRGRIEEGVHKGGEDEEFHVTTSVGVAQLKGASKADTKAVTSFLHDADEALYRAKEGGRNRVCV